LLERLRDNLADFSQNHFHKSPILHQDVTCSRSILIILVQILQIRMRVEG
jgi:hypothetical protein